MLGVMIVATVAASLALVRAGGAGRPVDLARAGRWVPRSPVTGLIAVIGLIYLNQVLFTVYVLREHSGDPSFIAQHVPDGWFSLAHGPVLEFLARHFPVPQLLAPSVLRVNAFLELPFVLLSYLVVCGWFSAWTYERALALVWPMSVSYTATFCMIEWHLYNQYTVQDIVVRIVAAVVVPWWITRLGPTRSHRSTESLPGLLVFLASALGLGVVVLVVYDTALLYNLGHVDTQLPLAALAILVLATARTIAPRVSTHPSGPGTRSIAWTTAWLLVLTAVPALPIRYGLGFGAPYVAVAGAVVLFTVAAVLGARATFARTPGRRGRWLVHMTAVAIAGLCAAAAVAMVVHTEHIEARLLIAGSTGVLVALLVSAGLDWRAKDAEGRPAGTNLGPGAMTAGTLASRL